MLRHLPVWTLRTSQTWLYLRGGLSLKMKGMLPRSFSWPSIVFSQPLIKKYPPGSKGHSRCDSSTWGYQHDWLRNMHGM